MPDAAPRRFVRQAPGKFDKTQYVDIRITDMIARDAAWWDARLGPKHAGIATRADRYWAWSVLLPMCHLVQLANRRSCRPLVVWARTDTGGFLRVGMSIRKNDGRFFFANEGRAEHVAEMLDFRR